ncbi:alkyl sulfatase C-terminal domain-containing protein [Nitrobacter sp. TKz-YC02]|uniref:alkyl sulfatase C-terminal domain-containing protein n=1 Tax=Nitrobacter sp. TKz-YC02 TaxID=3398704 RepID=UPI003CF97948
MSTEQWLDFIGISLDPKKADGMQFTINLVTPDNGEQYAIEMSNATLTNIRGFQAKNPTLTVTVNRADLKPSDDGSSVVRRFDRVWQGSVRRRSERF